MMIFLIALAGNIPQQMIVIQDDGFDFKWLIAAILIPALGLYLAWRQKK